MKIYCAGDRDKRWFSAIVTVALAMILADAGAIRSQPLQIAPGFPEPLSVSGVSGGPNNSGDCGFVAQGPNQVIEVTQDLPYWRIAVQTAGAPSLMIQGPRGRFCVLPANAAAGNVEFSGYGDKGTYVIFVGDRSQGQHPYSLSISQQRK
ncbi:MAG: hypothetical protein JGK17_31580 [Microcoleus sp. PH2017_10_PVI_O_A]|uniref:hypothetical protein n=1 Tax=unclassified Microcoleus TaxID=2642155 RepID=UPI001D4495A5|nr:MULTISPECIES: hypothetical protein [unclassified Microcoleus]TAE84564.1 MAG: hypothetical protein EAZ83_06350 [Oscillatoriales cyanobacterium]MCC3409998.1 hypothetical protein [Microcoleus sp. PH2017_10_PVI_O_A]MCC3464262.1 hypothetical protein [Microcoleus sp. PH2017_11_PCY_U_A]MCC3482607.1 hypothetical protein [Microcoleus sp. PH2017_12_PCY_D_A]MCC3563601.1 hypothetical protein [Microcoleus sp. PH2017_27_LUM_O_A]